jgi:hypothetical protein
LIGQLAVDWNVSHWHECGLDKTIKVEPNPEFVANEDYDAANLEHIIPLNPSPEWKISAEDAASAQTMIGNLTLLSAKKNVAIANSTFAEKVKVYRDLQRAVERMHTCKATLVQSVPVTETFEGKTVWEGVVHVFDLQGHLTATRAYAWSSSIEGSDKRRFFAVLHQEPVTSPVEAVRAAIVAESKHGSGENDG